MQLTFQTIRGYPNAIEEGLEVVERFQEVEKKQPADTMALGQDWEMYVAEKELYAAVKFVLEEQCANIVFRVRNGRGYELLQLLALKFDPVMLHLRQTLMSSIYVLANDKCKDFRATAVRNAYI